MGEKIPFWTALELETGDRFRLEATTKDGIEGTVLDRFVDADEGQILVPYRGPSDRTYAMYTLTIDIHEQDAFHAHGPPGDQQARGRVTAFELLED